MEYREFTIDVFEEAKEAIIDILLGEGIEYWQQEERGNIWTCKFYLSLASDWQELWLRIQERIRRLPEYGLRINPCSFSDRNQNLDWLKDYLDIRREANQILPGIWVVPVDFKDYGPAHNWYIKLKTGLAFGTGDHPSTKLALSHIKDYFQNLEQILDLGTGSGILALAAVLNGAQNVLALDNDPEAVLLAQENVRLNDREEQIKVVLGDATAQLVGSYNGVLINILYPIIVQILPKLEAVVEPGGLVLLSGILAREVNPLLEEIKKIPFRVEDVRVDEEWASILLVR